ncbi:hypothetical protein EU546_01445 [Candidatus Thorarchaeota archaeon]|nr:MAG: hypothetical protein EU546_01445 [Candidatus Thorarchaeota archaeon]
MTDLGIETFNLVRSQYMWPGNVVGTISGKVALPICSDCREQAEKEQDRRAKGYLVGAVMSGSIIPFFVLMFSFQISGVILPASFVTAPYDLLISWQFQILLALLGNFAVPLFFLYASKYLRANRLRSPTEVFFNATPSRGGGPRFVFRNQAYYESFKQANPDSNSSFAPSYRYPKSDHFNPVAMSVLTALILGIIMAVSGMALLPVLQTVFGPTTDAFVFFIPIGVIALLKLLWTAIRGNGESASLRFIPDLATLGLSLNGAGMMLVGVSIAAGYGGSLVYLGLLTIIPVVLFVIGVAVARLTSR